MNDSDHVALLADASLLLGGVVGCLQCGELHWYRVMDRLLNDEDDSQHAQELFQIG
ncbi:MAG: hypothetical protein KF745_13595 [Phycisphaeraceae bacterium]|nr:hypothetical protein [Phycisphaeraceae bacterium]